LDYFYSFSQVIYNCSYSQFKGT